MVTESKEERVDPEQFERLCKMLEQLGVEYSQDGEWRSETGDGKPPRHKDDINIFRGIIIPWTPEQWRSVGCCEGDDYLGGCCGTMSAVQDEVECWFRFGPYVDAYKIAEVASLFVGHGDPGWEPAEDIAEVEKLFGEKSDGFKELSPWDQLLLIWKILSLHYVPDLPTGRTVRKPDGRNDMSPVIDAVRQVSRYSLAVAFSHMFSRRDDERESYEVQQRDANTFYDIARIYPGMRRLWQALQAMEMSFEGYGLYDRKREAIAENHLGLLVCREAAPLERVLTLCRQQEGELREDDERHTPIDERYVIRPVRITEEGLVYTDEM